MTPAQRRRAEVDHLAQLLGAGLVSIEVTADGVRFRDDLPLSVELTPLAELLLVDVDAPIPLVAAS